MRKALNIFICTLLLIAFTIISNSAISTNAKAASALEAELAAMVDAGIVKGYGGGDLRPNLNVTRGQFATFMARALNLPKGPHVFSDVSTTSPLAPGINSAYAANLISGYSKTTFAPNKQISRQEASAIIARALITYKGSVNIQPVMVFSDATQISPTFKDSVNLNAEHKIIRGIDNGNGTYRFLPQKTATRAEAAAFISRLLNVPGSKVNPSLYTISTIENGSIKPTTQAFSSLDQAKAARTASNQLIVRQGKIIYTANGIVRPKKVITLYINSDLSDHAKNFVYAAHQEMKFIDATTKYIKVQVGGATAYAKPSEVRIIPVQVAKGRNYYMVNANGELIHNIYIPEKLKYELPYIAGKGPTSLQTGVKYYSWNGADYTTATGAKVSSAYQYFNYLSARSRTSYTAAELNSYINQRLIEAERLYKNNPSGYYIYKDATKRSKLRGLGTALKAAETNHRINALMILSMAMHESQLGMSTNALYKNNLFGLNAIDGTNGASTFSSPAASIDALATVFLNKKYIEPGSMYFTGSILGNKGNGFNVKYASDPYWGQKIAGAMFKADRALGGKDLGKYRIAATKIGNVNVRANVGTASTIQFKYGPIGIPVTIKTSVTHTDGTWYQAISDSRKYTSAYIRGTDITILPIAK
jgi:beta-N-acetylglucosaminidase